MGKTTMGKEDLIFDEARVLITAELRPWLSRVVANRLRASNMAQKMEIIKTLPSTTHQIELLLANQENISMGFSEWKDLQLNLKPELSRIFNPLKKIKRFSLRSVQLLSEVFLKEYREAINVAYHLNDFDWMNDEDLAYLTNIATSTYLERWLEKDRSSKKTLYDFEKYGYKRKKDCIYSVVDEDKDKLNKLYKAYEKYSELLVMRQVQAKADHESAPVAPYRRHNKTSLDLVTLSWCNAWANGHLKLLEFWLFRKHFINRKSRRDTNQNEKLHEVLGLYNELIMNINEARAQTEKDPSKYIEYVTNCVLVQKIERVYRFGLISELVKYCQSFELEFSDFDTLVLEAYFGRFSEIDGLLFTSINIFDADGKKEYVRSNDPLGLLNYKKIIATVAHTHRVEMVYAEACKEMMRRCALMDLLTLMYMLFPFDQQHGWQAEDYKAAADFYCESYPIMSCYDGNSSDSKNKMDIRPNVYAASMDEREKAHQFYDLFHECYMLIYNMNDSPLKAAMDDLATKKRPAV
jgi:hypothetical protein